MPRRRASALLVLVLAAASLAGMPEQASAATKDTLPGIDVSHWQGKIDWTKVAADGVTFAIVKATEGRNYVDPMYATNAAGATANGIAVGAYHFASPGPQQGDATAEADNFLQVARNDAGDVLPALDLEQTGGLNRTELQNWVKEWLDEVRVKLGVRAMIYTSPSFWMNAMGDTEWFADNGYTTLWIAHWGVNSPTVPANNWGGHGWTFWQWTDCWHVKGIGGCVDGDRYNGTNLIGGEIAQLTVAPTGGGAITGSRISCGDGDTRCSRLTNPGDSLALTATPDPDASLLGWGGACGGAGTSPTCTVTMYGKRRIPATFGYTLSLTKQGTGDGTVSSSPSGISCGSTCAVAYPYGSDVVLSAKADSASGFGSWSGACGGSSSTCAVTLTGPVAVSADFDAAVLLADDGTGTRYSWGDRKDDRALGGSYLLEHRAGASVAFAFRGTSVTWYTIESPGMGKARVDIDGVTLGTFSGYAGSFRAGVERTFKHLGTGSHRITITALGTASTLATGAGVAVDAIGAAGMVRKTPQPSHSTWSRQAAASAQDGSYLVSDVEGATTSLRFTGTGVSWTTVLGPKMGRAQVWIDGNLVRTVDLSATDVTYGAVRTFSGLADAHHVVRIVVLGMRGANGTGTAIAVDAWTVR